jgi:bifunctional DNA-binding transcriptional regulator/antitoxin component of YhaV-PrlF toxin-antitoxin module
MDITKLSDQGQVTIPQRAREQCHWEDGQELIEDIEKIWNQ